MTDHVQLSINGAIVYDSAAGVPAVPPNTTTPTPPAETPPPARASFYQERDGDMIGGPGHAGSGLWRVSFSNPGEEHSTVLSFPFSAARTFYGGDPAIAGGEIGFRLRPRGTDAWDEISNGSPYAFAPGDYDLLAYAKDLPQVHERGTGPGGLYLTA